MKRLTCLLSAFAQVIIGESMSELDGLSEELVRDLVDRGLVFATADGHVIARDWEQAESLNDEVLGEVIAIA